MVYKLEDVAKPLPLSLPFSLLFRLHTEYEIEKTIKQRDRKKTIITIMMLIRLRNGGD